MNAFNASPAGYNEPLGEPAILHTICWGCWYYVDGRSSMYPMCDSPCAPGSHFNRTTCCFHPSDESNAAAERELERQKREAEKRAKCAPGETVTFHIHKEEAARDTNPLAKDLPRL